MYACLIAEMEKPVLRLLDHNPITHRLYFEESFAKIVNGRTFPFARLLPRSPFGRKELVVVG